MAEAETVVAGLEGLSGVSLIGLVLNHRGLERALETAVDEVNFVVAAAEGYNHANQGVPVAETMRSIESMVPEARDAGRRVTVTISVAFGDPYDGEVAPEAVIDLARRSVVAGADEIALGDTIGVAVPTHVTALLALLTAAVPGTPVRCHFHDTRRAGLANMVAALVAGVTIFDTSVGGLGGSPFAPAAGGNIATEDAVVLLERMGVATGFDLDATLAAGRWLGSHVGHLPAAMQHAARWPPSDTPSPDR
jgi:hydroxymethylglutaryl-CoA lyase